METKQTKPINTSTHKPINKSTDKINKPMKKIILLFITTLFLASCGGDKKQRSVEDIIASQDLNEIRSKKDEITNMQIEMANQINLLDEQIEKLDSLQRIPLITTFISEGRSL